MLSVYLLGEFGQEAYEMILSAQLHKLSLDRNVDKMISKYIKENGCNKDFILIYMFLNLFCPFSKEHLSDMDWCCQKISKTDNFLQLDLQSLKKFLSSSKLLITSEFDVIRAAILWVNFNYRERSKFAQSLLLTVRLPLLNENVLRYFLKNKSLSFRGNNECLLLVNKILENSNCTYEGKSIEYFKPRLCARFNFLTFGGKNKITKKPVRKIMKFSKDFNAPEVISSLVEARYDFITVPYKNYVFTFDGVDGSPDRNNMGLKFFSTVERYNTLSNTCEVVADVKDINDENISCYSVCAFDDRIFLTGGHDDSEQIADYCYELNLNDFSWQEKSRMIEAREDPSSCVFEGKIIVTGGLQYNEDGTDVNYYDQPDDLVAAKTCESFDPVSDLWEYFPSMNFSRCCHQSVVINNKFYVIGGGTEVSEVYDSTCKKFTVLKKPVMQVHKKLLIDPVAAFSIGSEIYIFGRNSLKVLIFDFETNEWYEKPCEALKGISKFASVKVPYL